MTPEQRQALRELAERWRRRKMQIDTRHATMGIGFGACADELDALLASLPESDGADH